MLLKYIHLLRRLQSTLGCTIKMDLGTCYFRHSEEKVHISFIMSVKSSARRFNLTRNCEENVENLESRIKANVEKVINKGHKKKLADPIDVNVKFYDEKKNVIPKDYTCLDLFSFKNCVNLKIMDNTYKVVFNVPWVLNINLPQSLLVGFPVYPEQFEAENVNKHQSSFLWYTGDPPEKDNGLDNIWRLTSSEFIYTPRVEDIGLKLKLECIPKNGDAIGPTFDIISKNGVEAGPGTCPFETRHLFTTSKLKHDRFRCVTYNILADLYCDSDFTRDVLHPYCPSYALQLDYRKHLILKELLGYNADVICLQEVDQKVFTHCLCPVMELNGFKGVFYKKGNLVAEGLSCFYREDRFKLLDQERIVLSDAIKHEPCLGELWEAVKNNIALTERLLVRSTVASVTVLESIDRPDEILVVGNTHLYFHPDADHIRLLQGGILIYWLSEVLEKIRKKEPQKRASLVLCGDFNSVPSCGIYQLYTTGIAPSSLADWHSNAKEAISNLTLKQNIILDSACGTPPFTNFTAGFADCLDYIFYEKENLEVEQVIPLPSLEELQQYTALPSIVFPSDHIALISDLKFRDKST